MKIVTTGQRIKSVREQAGMTQVELANKLNISYQSIGQWERDIRTPKQSTLTKIAKALGVHLRDLADTSIWEEFDKQYPNLGKESTEFEDFKTFLESIGYIVKFVPVGEEGESFTAELIKDGKKTEFSKVEFENFQLETKKSVDYQVWQKSQEKK